MFRNETGNQEDTTDMNSYIQRTGLTIDEQGNPDQSMVKRISAVWPKMKVNPDSADDAVNVYVGHQMTTEGDITWEGPYTFNPDTQSKVPVRVTGKYIGVKFESTTNTTWQLNGYSLDIKNAGNRGSVSR